MKTQLNTIVVETVEPSIDWLTGTSKNSISRNSMSREAHSWMEMSISDGNSVSVWSKYGYEGWAVGGLRWGRREQDDLVILSGELADELYDRYQRLLSNCSRMDLAVTVRLNSYEPGLAADAYKSIETASTVLTASRGYSIMSSTRGGDTLYVGSRSSDVFGRLYDKEKQSGNGEYRRCWRYEVELKHDIATEAWIQFANCSDRKQVIRGFVWEWFNSRGIPPVFEKGGVNGAIHINRKQTDAQRKLHWLERGVGPTVRWLLERGYRTDVLRALSLNDENN